MRIVYSLLEWMGLKKITMSILLFFVPRLDQENVLDQAKTAHLELKKSSNTDSDLTQKNYRKIETGSNLAEIQWPVRGRE